MALKVPQNEEVPGLGKNTRGKGVDSNVNRRKANRESTNAKETKQEKVIWQDVDSYVVRVEVKQR